jgi:aspartate racemase
MQASMATNGFVTEEQRKVFRAASQRLLGSQGAEAILLAGTDLALVLDERNAKFPLVDCAGRPWPFPPQRLDPRK